MARVTTEVPVPSATFTLVLDAPEAQYVLESLRATMPRAWDGADPVWDALHDAMVEAGVPPDHDALA